MTKEVIDSLHEVLKNNICTLKRTSTDTTNKVAMCESKMIVVDFEFVRNNVKYILVYNGEKYSKIQESKARSQNYDYIMKLANQEEKLFEIDRFEKYLFDETHTYTAVSFEKKFVRIKEEEEANG